MTDESQPKFSKGDLVLELNGLIEPLGLDYDTYEELMVSIIKVVEKLPN